ncbi:MAG: phosphoglycerate kinase, partial [candidate division Zixibacteria bacterium]|nr:phosphoglycerate kinase [candidate division Zixibacteria bacterium]
KMSQSLMDGEVLLLENLRYHKEETDNDPSFAEQLAKHGELYVNDAFGTAHRAHASTEGVTKFIKICAGGYLMKKEIEYLDSALADPKRPFVAVLGGAKISGKIDVIEKLLDKVDAILIGGGMIFTFLKAMGKNIGDSLLEEDRVALARETLAKANSKGVKFLLPSDCLAADDVSESAKVTTVPADNIPDGLKGLDIGPDSIKQ